MAGNPIADAQSAVQPVRWPSRQEQGAGTNLQVTLARNQEGKSVLLSVTLLSNHYRSQDHRKSPGIPPFFVHPSTVSISCTPLSPNDVTKDCPSP